MPRSATRTFLAFGEEPLSEVFNERLNALRADVMRRTQDYILNVNEDDYIAYLTDQFSVSPPILDFASVAVSQHEKEFRAEELPNTIVTRPGGRYMRPVVVYNIPFSGNESLFRRCPSSFSDYFPRVFITSDSCLCLSYPVFSDDPAKIKRAADHDLRCLQQSYQMLKEDIESFNHSLFLTARGLFEGRKQELLKRNNFLESLGVPLRQRTDLPETFAIPRPQAVRKIVPAPIVTEKGYKP